MRVALALLAGCPAAPAPPSLPTPPSPEAVCEAFEALDRAEVSWEGDPGTCDPGGFDGAERARAWVGFVRELAGLPPLATSPELDDDAQACALLMHANGDTSHEPPPDWSCWTEGSRDTARVALLADLPLMAALPGLLVDIGNEATLGHRRWLLSGGLTELGFGSTDAYTCLALGGDFELAPGVTTWPPHGPVPRALLEAYGVHTDEVGWLVQSDAIDLRGATARVTVDDQDPVDAEVTSLPDGFGSRFALRIAARDWSSADRVRVELQGVDPPVAWEVQPVDCAAAQARSGPE